MFYSEGQSKINTSTRGFLRLPSKTLFNQWISNALKIIYPELVIKSFTTSGLTNNRDLNTYQKLNTKLKNFENFSEFYMGLCEKYIDSEVNNPY